MWYIMKKSHYFLTFIVFLALFGTCSVEESDDQPTPTITPTPTATVNGITFIKKYGNEFEDGGYSVIQTNDLGFLFCGYSSPGINIDKDDVFVLKTDRYGFEEWSKIFGSERYDSGSSVQQTQDGGYIITGIYDATDNGLSNMEGDIFLCKLDQFGDEVWFKIFGGEKGDFATSVKQTLDGGFIVVGGTYSFGNGGVEPDVYLIKTDQNGNELFTKTFGGTSFDYGNDIIITNDNGFLICGDTGENGYSDILILKINNFGSEEWRKVIGDNNPQYGHSVCQIDEGDYVIGGSEYYINEEESRTSIILLLLHSNGNIEWYKNYSFRSLNSCYGIDQTVDNAIVACGRTKDPGENSDAFLLKSDLQGNVLWRKTNWAGNLLDGYSVKQTDDAGFIMCGEAFGQSGYYSDAFLLKTDSFGNVEY